MLLALVCLSICTQNCVGKLLISLHCNIFRLRDSLLLCLRLLVLHCYFLLVVFNHSIYCICSFLQWDIILLLQYELFDELLSCLWGVFHQICLEFSMIELCGIDKACQIPDS